jgi:hypothetical protein
VRRSDQEMRGRADHALVRVSNVTDGQGVALYWIHHDGEERLYTRICPGQVYTQRTATFAFFLFSFASSSS